MKRICICGGGALGLLMAAVLSNKKDCSISLLTGHPQLWSNDVSAYDSNGQIYKGHIDRISDCAQDVIPSSDVVLLCVPGFLIEKTLLLIQPYISSQAVGTIVSSTGFFFFAHKIFPSSVPLYGFQRVPYIARVDTYGRIANLLGYKKQLYMATENLPSTFEQQWSEWLQVSIEHLDNYLQASLSNSNPLLHPARLYGMWHNLTENTYYKNNIFFYADWDEYSSEIYIQMDNEFQQLCQILNVKVEPVLQYYESTDAISLTNKLRSIAAFRTILAPMVKYEKGWRPDFKSRYFTEDFPFGLQLVKDLAEKHHLKTPIIDTVLNWGNEFI